MHQLCSSLNKSFNWHIDILTAQMFENSNLNEKQKLKKPFRARKPLPLTLGRRTSAGIYTILVSVYQYLNLNKLFQNKKKPGIGFTAC
jgi:hypothetical protein